MARVRRPLCLSRLVLAGLVLAGLVLLAIAGGGRDSDESTDAVGAGVGTVTGPRAWEGTWTAELLGNTEGAAVPDLPRGTTFTLHLGGGVMRGDDGCNTFGSYYSASRGDVRFGPVESTAIGCDSTSAFLSVLSQVRHATGGPSELLLHGDRAENLLLLERVGDTTEDDLPESEIVDLPTSEWTPGSGGDGAEISGDLSLDEDNCVYLDSDGSKVWPVWPKGYTALVVHGELRLLDAEVKEVASQGDALNLGGGFTSSYTPTTGVSCLPGDAEVALVQSDLDGPTPDRREPEPVKRMPL